MHLAYDAEDVSYSGSAMSDTPDLCIECENTADTVYVVHVLDPDFVSSDVVSD